MEDAVDKILSLYEKLATPVYKKIIIIEVFVPTSVLIGIYLMEYVNKTYGFLLAVAGIWMAGIGIFSSVFALKEKTLTDGEYVISSTIRNSSIFVAIIFMIFIALWFLGLFAITIFLFMEIIHRGLLK